MKVLVFLSLVAFAAAIPVHTGLIDSVVGDYDYDYLKSGVHHSSPWYHLLKAGKYGGYGYGSIYDDVVYGKYGGAYHHPLHHLLKHTYGDDIYGTDYVHGHPWWNLLKTGRIGGDIYDEVYGSDVYGSGVFGHHGYGYGYPYAHRYWGDIYSTVAANGLINDHSGLGWYNYGPYAHHYGYHGYYPHNAWYNTVY